MEIKHFAGKFYTVNNDVALIDCLTWNNGRVVVWYYKFEEETVTFSAHCFDAEFPQLKKHIVRDVHDSFTLKGKVLSGICYDNLKKIKKQIKKHNKAFKPLYAKGDAVFYCGNQVSIVSYEPDADLKKYWINLREEGNFEEVLVLEDELEDIGQLLA